MPKSTETTYQCKICNTGPDQLSHNQTHCKSMKHIQCCQIFKLELEKLKDKEIKEKYPDYKSLKTKKKRIDKIITDMSSVKTVVEKESEAIECKKYKPSNEIVWELSENVDINENYKQIYETHTEK